MPSRPAGLTPPDLASPYDDQAHHYDQEDDVAAPDHHEEPPCASTARLLTHAATCPACGTCKVDSLLGLHLDLAVLINAGIKKTVVDAQAQLEVLLGNVADAKNGGYSCGSDTTTCIASTQNFLDINATILALVGLL